ncbi:MAG: hypothetical protein V4664_01565 [Patescibacteria group bacterium]
MESNIQNVNGMNVEQSKPQPNNGIGKFILTIIIVALLVGAGYYVWIKYGNEQSAVQQAAITKIPRVDNSTTSRSISADIEAAGSFNNSGNMNAVDQEFK